ncbi:MAG: flavodoxin family protein [Promethearchaeota archaeon]
MKQILGIVGSPRINGNTHVLVSKILDGAKEMNAKVDMIFLNKLNIKECDGCHVCWEGNQCNKNDDMIDIYQKIIESDIIIFGTPVYWYGPTGLMKLFLDRFVFFNSPENREKIKGKKAILVVPFEEENFNTVALLISLFEKSFQYLEITLIEKLIIPGVTKRGEVSEKKEIMDKAFQLGKYLCSIKT